MGRDLLTGNSLHAEFMWFFIGFSLLAECALIFLSVNAPPEYLRLILQNSKIDLTILQL